ncbi:hypothetical protein MO973_10495 [Paenibacillus sp. TRM 82003]|nr:hypothetical protein [Paenibacillus sp. TRM 82003]
MPIGFLAGSFTGRAFADRACPAVSGGANFGESPFALALFVPSCPPWLALLAPLGSARLALRLDRLPPSFSTAVFALGAARYVGK